MRVLLVRLDGIGDAAVCTPLIVALLEAGHEVGVALTTRNAGIFAPHGTPQAVVAQLNTEINKVLNEPDTRQRLVEAGAEVEPLSVDQFRAFVDAESSKYARIIKETGVTAE